jgi:His/Glu/Gln/Arg/opine family amino acid ABC transporter permease subunit
MTVAFVTAWLDPGMRSTLAVLRNGVAITIRITLVGFALAMAFGVAAGLARTSENRMAREAATLYVEVVRGIPLLVLILWVGFGFTPWLLAAIVGLVGNLAESGTAEAVARPIADLLEPCSQPRRCVPLEVRGVIGLPSATAPTLPRSSGPGSSRCQPASAKRRCR